MSVDMRVGTVVEVLPFPEARKPAYKVRVDLGKVRVDLGPELGHKWSSAQLTVHYQPEDLVGRQVLCVVSLGTRQIGPFLSEVLITGADAEGGVVVFTTERPAGAQRVSLVLTAGVCRAEPSSRKAMPTANASGTGHSAPRR